MELLIAYLIIWGIRTTLMTQAVPSYIPFLRVAIICTLFPIEVVVKLISFVYRFLGVGVYFECSVLMTEEELENISDEIDLDDQDDR